MKRQESREFSLEKEESTEKIEKGKNNRILIKIMRHGEKTPEGFLTDYGREVTRKKSKSEKDMLYEFKKVKAVGSNKSEPGQQGLPRALETADIYANGITIEEGENLPEAEAKIKKYKTRPRPILGTEAKVPELFNWKEYYKSQLPKNFDQMTDEEKAEASHKANEACINRVLEMPEGQEYRQDIASRYAFFANRYLNMIDRLEDNTKVLYPAGAHGGNMEVFLQQCLKRKKKNREELTGFNNVSEIGGAFRPSEGFFIDITTNDKGEKQVKVFMDNTERLEGEELSLDLGKIEELVKEYEKNYTQETS